MASAAETITQAWFKRSLWLYLLWPLSLLYFMVITLRRAFYRLGVFSCNRVAVPVIVVGNLTVGGSGKSPLVSYLVSNLTELGLKVGVVSRGYGAQIPKNDVREVSVDSLVTEVGDEPLMLKHRLSCLIAVSPNRSLAAQYLVDKGCDIVLADDGLQHYALHRDIEICVLDGRRGWGNRQLLPVGPLREPLSRLRSVDYYVLNGANDENQSRLLFDRFGESELATFSMSLKPVSLYRLDNSLDRVTTTWAEVAGQKVNAVAAIGHPERFFSTLEKLDLKPIRHAFADHHAFRAEDFQFQNDFPIIMTEKDAVKCRGLALENAWVLSVSAELDKNLTEQLISTLTKNGYFNG